MKHVTTSRIEHTLNILAKSFGQSLVLRPIRIQVEKLKKICCPFFGLPLVSILLSSACLLLHILPKKKFCCVQRLMELLSSRILDLLRKLKKDFRIGIRLTMKDSHMKQRSRTYGAKCKNDLLSACSALATLSTPENVGIFVMVSAVILAAT